MFVRVLNFTCRQDTEIEQIREVYKHIAEHARTVDGFIGSTLLMRQHACCGMAMMYWESEDAAVAAGTGIVTLLGEHAHALMDGPPEVQGYHVIENGILSQQDES
jgi:heme-degrading monooxygenase HmoA